MAVFFCVAASSSGCGGSGSGSGSSECSAGTERCECYGNGTCNAGLECRSDLCVEVIGSTGTAGAAGSGNLTNVGGQQATGGTSTAGGMSSAGGVLVTAGSTGSVTTSNNSGAAGSTGVLISTSQGGAPFGIGGAGAVAGNNAACVVMEGGRCFVLATTGPYCGDGKLDPSNNETCDDGNRVVGDGCSSACQLEPNSTCPFPGKPCQSLIVCGNAIRQIGEGCDDGNISPGDGCDATCRVEAGWFCLANAPCQRLAACGDGKITTGESCDLGADNGKALGCTANCRVEEGWICSALPPGCSKILACGNRHVDAGEDCDDGNVVSGDGCSSACKRESSSWDCPATGGHCIDTSRCGNGIIEMSETCDDANSKSSDGCSASCQLEMGWQCRVAGKSCAPRCGDQIITATETCDDGNASSGDGCSSSCQLEPGWSCSGSTCTKSVCGDGVAQQGESCDAGYKNGLFYGDGKGCSKTCTKEPDCRPNGTTQACSTVCGDGNKDSGEECDDGNGVSGDGCSAQCHVEVGFSCKDTEVPDLTDCSTGGGKCLVLPIVYRDFEGQQVSGGHPDFFYLGAAANGGRTTGVTPGATKTTCVPIASGTKAMISSDGKCPNTDATGPCLGLVKDTLGSDGKPQYNKNICPCVFTDWDKTGLLGTCPASGSGDCTPDSKSTGVTQCYIEGSGAMRLRVDSNVAVIQSVDSFKQWYNDSSSAVTSKGTLELSLMSGGDYRFSSSNGRTVADDVHDIFMGTNIVTSLQSGFFPLEDQSRTKVCNLWPYWLSGLNSATNCVAKDGNPIASQWDPKGSATPGLAGTGGPVKPVTGVLRNFYFTTEVHYLFRYTAPVTMAFRGDDDVWVFINGKLAMDLGAPHERLQASTSIDGQWGLTPGNIYEIAVFHADRQPRESNYELTLPASTSKRTTCKSSCGDEFTSFDEECDNGAANQDGLYNGCTRSCKWGPYCGDGVLNGNEECDDGKNSTLSSSAGSMACGPGCKLPSRCGDGKLQAGEQCDDGASNSSSQCGGCSQRCEVNPICGDGHIDTQCGEQCDDGLNLGGYGQCKAGCLPDARCGDGKVDTLYGETCDLGDGRNGVADSSGKVLCTATCGVPGVCGDKLLTAPETCDDGINDGSYGSCTPDCQRGPYCGDGVRNGSEECDYGGANTPPTQAIYGGCLTSCKLGPRCGDGLTQSPYEQCDEGGPTSKCSANCMTLIQVP